MRRPLSGVAAKGLAWLLAGTDMLGNLRALVDGSPGANARSIAALGEGLAQARRTPTAMSQSTTLQLREAVRAMLLPIRAENEAAVVLAARERLTRWGHDAADHAEWLSSEREEWVMAGTASAELRQLVHELLTVGDADYGGAIADAYFPAHAHLAELPHLSHELASALLSHGRLIAGLVDKERMSAAQVARLVRARDPRLPVGWKDVRWLLNELGLEPEITQTQMATSYADDAEAEQEFFADAEISECAAIVGDVAWRLGYPTKLEQELRALASMDEPIHVPYLQILHYQCVIAEFYDHALSTVYEFKPRGAVADWLSERYPAALRDADNPFLNNLKAVDILDQSWAASRRSAQAAPARALASIIAGLESLGFAARRELAGWLRRWLCRQIRLAEGQAIAIPTALSGDEVARLLDRVAAGNTETRGIIEQRVVDALSDLLHPAGDWIARGLGDAVNANNVSRGKFGDADFQHSARRSVVAYEPHGGTLSRVYLWRHQTSVRKVLARRRKEWDTNVAPGLVWEVSLVFVAHTFALDAGIGLYDFSDGGTTVTFQALTFAELIAKVRRNAGEAAMVSSINNRLTTVFAEDRTPEMARRRLLELIAP